MRTILILAAAGLVACLPRSGTAQTCYSSTSGGSITTRCSDGTTLYTTPSPSPYDATTHITRPDPPPSYPALNPQDYIAPFHRPPPPNDFGPGGVFESLTRRP